MRNNIMYIKNVPVYTIEDTYEGITNLYVAGKEVVGTYGFFTKEEMCKCALRYLSSWHKEKLSIGNFSNTPHFN